MSQSHSVPIQETAILLFGRGQKAGDYFIVGNLLHLRTAEQH